MTMKTKTSICPVCNFLVCHACKSHRFPANEKFVEAAEKKHGEKKTGCGCPKGGGRIRRVLL